MSVRGRHVTRELWDLRRLANWAASGNRAEPIVAEFPDGLPALATPGTDEDHSVLLAIVPARTSPTLYATHGARLLELNVRSFLQVRGAVNKGSSIRCGRTRSGFSPTTTASRPPPPGSTSTDAPTGQRAIQRIHDLQIVNGGQTTATIHHAHRNRVDLRHVYVQMKLTVVAPDRLDDIVPQISAYSNTQNRVTASDLKANSAFHVDVERIMRTLWAPATAAHPHDTHWFYERARGQYANALAREGTPARQKIFKTVNPPDPTVHQVRPRQVRTLVGDAAHVVSLGAEKNFALFSDASRRIRSPSTRTTAGAWWQRRSSSAAPTAGRQAEFRRLQGQHRDVHRGEAGARRPVRDRSRSDLARAGSVLGVTAGVDRPVGLVHKKITDPPEGGPTSASGRSDRSAGTRSGYHVAAAARSWPNSSTSTTTPPSWSWSAALRPRDWADLAAWGAGSGQLTAGQCRAAADIAHALSQGWDPAGKQLHSARCDGHACRNGFRPVTGF